MTMKPGIVVALALVVACRNDSAKSTTATRPDRYNIGQPASAGQIAAIDIDANPTGVGLPVGQGSAQRGAAVYAAKCSLCHGVHGEGVDKAPRLIGREPPAGFVFASDAKVPKTIGNYWPYATTLYDYIHRAMPLNAPGSLAPDEVYGLVAFLLSENGIIPASAVIDAKSLPAVKMPAQPHFVKDNRTGGSTFR